MRHVKALNQACPYKNDHAMCSVPYVRCGERHQFATRESHRQQTMPHMCMYRPGNSGDYFVVADNDRRVRDFVKNALELFLNIDESRIVTLDSAQKAIDTLNQFKIQNKRVRLLIVDENMPGMNGFELVNELYSRNHNVQILLMHDPARAVNKPRDYAGDRYIAPRRRVVNRTLLKPIHSDTLAEAALEMVGAPER